MKKILFAVAMVLFFNGVSFSYTEVDLSREAAFSNAVAVSTTPVLFASSSTRLNLEEIQVWNYTADVIYINFTLPTSSTTAAATGIKVFQSDKNDGFLSFLLNKFVNVYFTLAADSGTSSLRVLELGRKP